MSKKQDEVMIYFGECGIDVSLSKFDFKSFRIYHDLSKKAAVALLCNLEDENIMQDIANGNYDTFNENDSDQFNDSYEDVIKEFLR